MYNIHILYVSVKAFYEIFLVLLAFLPDERASKLTAVFFCGTEAKGLREKRVRNFRIT